MHYILYEHENYYRSTMVILISNTLSLYFPRLIAQRTFSDRRLIWRSEMTYASLPNVGAGVAE